MIRYYTNILWTRIQRKYIVKYDNHMYSDYFLHDSKYAGTVVHNPQDSNIWLRNAILSGRPLMCARFGSTELYNFEVFDQEIVSKYNNAMNMLCTNSGFFPNMIDLGPRFAEKMADGCEQVDMLGIWNMFMEAYYIKHKMKKDVYLTQLRWLEPWFSNEPWTQALKGKKVLVIHPFEETIIKQYMRREKLFADGRILPEFDLYTVKAVQTLAGTKDNRFSTWFDALQFMYGEAIKIDFDIALLGCGAYGFPLASMLKKSGKQAIHLGGVLQILFGIQGKRWDDDENVAKLYNEFWVRPGDNEKPAKANKVEDGCYW